MTNEQYIEHEVKLRVHEAIFNHMDYKFTKLEESINGIKRLGYWIIATSVTGIALPIGLHYYHFI